MEKPVDGGVVFLEPWREVETGEELCFAYSEYTRERFRLACLGSTNSPSSRHAALCGPRVAVRPPEPERADRHRRTLGLDDRNEKSIHRMVSCAEVM